MPSTITKIEGSNVVTLPRRLLLLLVAVLIVVAMTVVTAGPALASDLTKDTTKQGTAKDKKGKLKDLFK